MYLKCLLPVALAAGARPSVAMSVLQYRKDPTLTWQQWLDRTTVQYNSGEAKKIEYSGSEYDSMFVWASHLEWSPRSLAKY